MHPVWEVCWCEEQQRFWFQHTHSGQGMYEIPRERASASAVFREILEPSVPFASSGPDGSDRSSVSVECEPVLQPEESVVVGEVDCSDSQSDARCEGNDACEEAGNVSRPPVPHVVAPWEVYWCAERLEYWFYNVETGESTFSQRRASEVSSEAVVCDGDAGVLADLGGAVGDTDEDRHDESVHVSDSACHAAVAPVRDFFDLLAELPRGPKQFSKKNPQAPTSIYCRNGASVYVGGFEAASDAGWLEQAGVGLVVSVLGLSLIHI